MIALKLYKNIHNNNNNDAIYNVNKSKSEVSNVSCDNFQCVMIAIESALPEVTVTECEDQSIHGAPIDINGCRTGVHNVVELEFVPVAVETSGIIISTAFCLLTEIWGSISRATNDPHQTSSIFQQISVAIIPGNELSTLSSLRRYAQK